MTDPKTDRRPITTRNAGWARRAAHRLAASAITPNQISIASMVAALAAGGAFWGAGHTGVSASAVLLILAAAFCQARLICNLLDGMVAVEGGKREPSGPFWNEFPDRVADILILGGAGLGIANPALGFAAASMAVFTAYVRELGRATGAPSDFSGPMAKPHRMATMTGAALLAVVEPWLPLTPGTILIWGLWVVTIGAALTVLRRAVRLVGWLNARG
jgi:phosphatidylglycerophosphate synthase